MSALDTLLPRAPALSPPAISPSDPAFQQGAQQFHLPTRCVIGVLLKEGGQMGHPLYSIDLLTDRKREVYFKGLF